MRNKSCHVAGLCQALARTDLAELRISLQPPKPRPPRELTRRRMPAPPCNACGARSAFSIEEEVGLADRAGHINTRHGMHKGAELEPAMRTAVEAPKERSNA